MTRTRTRIELVQAILAEHKAKGGSTFNLQGENLAGRDLYAVSFIKALEYRTSLALDAHTLDRFIDDNFGLLVIPLNTAIGTWNEAGLNYIDIVALTPDRALAERAGRDANQIAICYLKTGEIITL